MEHSINIFSEDFFNKTLNNLLSDVSVSESVRDSVQLLLNQEKFTGRQGGCNDPFQIFGFLAFLLVLLQLLANNGGGRRRRSLAEEDSLCFDERKNNNNIHYDEGKLAIASVLRGYVKVFEARGNKGMMQMV